MAVKAEVPVINGSGLASAQSWLQEAIQTSDAVLQMKITDCNNGVIGSTGQDGEHADSSSTTRKLATVQAVKSVQHFNREHNITTVGGWTVMTKKRTQFQPGEFVLFLEVDSFLPSGGKFGSIFAEVRNPTTFEGKPGYRVGTQESTTANALQRKVAFQGHIFKLNHFPPILADVSRHQKMAANPEELASALRKVDYAGQLGIKKWESAKESSSVNYKFPPFIAKTDTERVQNCPNLFVKPKYKKFLFQESVKMDGSSMTCYFVNSSSKYFSHLYPLPADHEKRAVFANGRFGVCSKNYDLSNLEKNPYWCTALRNNLHIKLHKLGRSIAIQGELVGWNIQGNPYGYGKDQCDFFVFSVIDIESRQRWDPRKVEAFAEEQGLKHVEVLGYVKVPTIAQSHQDLLDRAERRDVEGLVFKNCSDGRWFKVLSQSYIINRGDEVQAAKAAGIGKAAAAAAAKASATHPAPTVKRAAPPPKASTVPPKVPMPAPKLLAPTPVVSKMAAASPPAVRTTGLEAPSVVCDTVVGAFWALEPIEIIQDAHDGVTIPASTPAEEEKLPSNGKPSDQTRIAEGNQNTSERPPAIDSSLDEHRIDRENQITHAKDVVAITAPTTPATGGLDRLAKHDALTATSPAVAELTNNRPSKKEIKVFATDAGPITVNIPLANHLVRHHQVSEREKVDEYAVADTRHEIVSNGWEMAKEELEELLDTWRHVSWNKSLSACDGDLGSWLDVWNREFYGESAPPLYEIFMRQNRNGISSDSKVKDDPVAKVGDGGRKIEANHGTHDDKPSKGVAGGDINSNSNGKGKKAQTMSGRYREFAQWLGL